MRSSMRHGKIFPVIQLHLRGYFEAPVEVLVAVDPSRFYLESYQSIDRVFYTTFKQKHFLFIDIGQKKFTSSKKLFSMQIAAATLIPT